MPRREGFAVLLKAGAVKEFFAFVADGAVTLAGELQHLGCAIGKNKALQRYKSGVNSFIILQDKSTYCAQSNSRKDVFTFTELLGNETDMTGIRASMLLNPLANIFIV